MSSSVGPFYAGHVVDQSGIGTLTWDSPGNAVGSDLGDYTNITGQSGRTLSHWLMCDQFGITGIPDDADVVGFELRISRSSDAASKAHDNSIRIFSGGSAVGNDKADTATWWPTSKSWSGTYGGAADAWDTSLKGSDVKASTFAIAISAYASKNSQARVWGIEITKVYYTGGSSGSTYNESVSFGVTASASPSANLVMSPSLSFGLSAGVYGGALADMEDAITTSVTAGLSALIGVSYDDALELSATFDFSVSLSRVISESLILAVNASLVSGASVTVESAIGLGVSLASLVVANQIAEAHLALAASLSYVLASSKTMEATLSLAVQNAVSALVGLSYEDEVDFGLSQGIASTAVKDMPESVTFPVSLNSQVTPQQVISALLSLGSLASLGVASQRDMSASITLASQLGLTGSLGDTLNELLSLGVITGLSASATQTLAASIVLGVSASIQARANTIYASLLTLGVSVGQAQVAGTTYVENLVLSVVASLSAAISSASVSHNIIRMVLDSVSSPSFAQEVLSQCRFYNESLSESSKPTFSDESLIN